MTDPDNLVLGWVSDPGTRGTLSIMISCIVTFTLCVWSALHLNVPPTASKARHLAVEKAKWVLYGIFAPEIVVGTAASQYITARWLKREIEKDAAYRNSQRNVTPLAAASSTETWSIAQCFYAVMGGCVADVPYANDFHKDMPSSITITPGGIRLLSFLGKLPKIDESQINDKSKANWMAKSIICLQVGWMVAQVLGRVAEELPVSLLEINTCGHVACAMLLYLTWWSKPMDIQDPSILGPEYDNTLLYLFLCSQISAVNDDVPDIRCFYYNFEGQDRNQLASLEHMGIQLPRVAPSSRDDLPESEWPVKLSVEMSRGSSANKNIENFIGYKGDVVKIPTEDGSTTMKYSYKLTTKLAPECLQYLQKPYCDISIRHGDAYCRRATLPSRDQTTYRPLAASYFMKASDTVHAIWAECDKRPSYRRLYFTINPVFKHVGVYLSEADYVVSLIPNFPSLSNLSLGQVDIHSELLPSIFAFTTFAYGGLHLSVLHHFLPSHVERIFWVIASSVIMASGALAWCFFSARLLVRKFKKHHASVQQIRWTKGVLRAILGATYLAGLVFILARVFLVVEAFVSLRKAPKELYLTPDWTNFVPHL